MLERSRISFSRFLWNQKWTEIQVTRHTLWYRSISIAPVKTTCQVVPIHLRCTWSTDQGRTSLLLQFFSRWEKTTTLEFQFILDAANKQNNAVVNLRNFSTAYTADTCFFDGSLTTPPCSEEVKWVLSTDVMKASVKQISEYREICFRSRSIDHCRTLTDVRLHGMQRPIQSSLYRQEKWSELGMHQ